MARQRPHRGKSPSHKGGDQGDRRSPPPRRQGRGGRPEQVWLCGHHLVRETLRAGVWPLARVLLQEGQESGELATLAQERRVPVEVVPRPQLDAVGAGVRHQGVAAQARPFPYVDLEATVETALQGDGPPPLLLLLAGIQDPHNLGAILRAAAGAGVNCVVLPRRGQVGITGAVARTSAGAVSWVPVAKVTNLNQTIRWLQGRGFWVYGASEKAPRSLYETDLRGPLALVVGGEGEGLRRLTAERCDELVSIPMAGELASLNASVAAGILLFEARRQQARLQQANPGSSAP